MVRSILMAFYEANHPEYANEPKISRIIESFKRKGREGTTTWVSLLWEAYEREGVDPREYCPSALTATLVDAANDVVSPLELALNRLDGQEHATMLVEAGASTVGVRIPESMRTACFLAQFGFSNGKLSRAQ